MEKTQEACHRVEWEGLSFREAKQVVEMELFLDEYPHWNIGSLTDPLFYTKWSYMPHHKGGKRQNICAAGLPRQCKGIQF